MDTLAIEKKINIEEFLANLILNGVSFALYRLPKSNVGTLLISKSGFRPIEKVDFEELPTGFVFAPFNSEKHNILYLAANFQQEIDLEHPKIQTNDFVNNKEVKDLQKHLHDLSIHVTGLDSDSLLYQSKVEHVINEIRQGSARKVVLSRKKKIGNLHGQNYYKGFKALCDSNVDAMVSWVYLPEIEQIWLGATPELLVSQDKDNIFKTVSLAGTQSGKDQNGDDILPINALWTHKEIEEQAIVSRYIVNCLKKIRVREFEEEGPKTVRAGNLLHLKTFYKIDNKEVRYPNLSSVMLNLLHPTPAICGMPKDDAMEVILNVEDYDREYYSGYLGPVNVNGESQVFVNLRTLKVENKEVFAFAGGGLTEDSKAENEWLETEIKMETVKGIFDIIS